MIRDLLQESYDAMRHNRRRTALTMLGMAWGIATVVMLLAYGDGFGRACANIFANFGTKLFIVVPGRSSMQSGGEKAGAQIRLTLDDVDLLTTNIPQITHITPDCYKNATVQYDTRSYTMNVNGEYPNTFAIRALTLAQGRFYNPQDQTQHARVAVIGSETKEKLFSGRNALGEHIRIDGGFGIAGESLAHCHLAGGHQQRTLLPFRRGYAAHRDYLGTEMRPEEWLLIEWPEGEAEPIKYFLSTAPVEATLEQLAFVTKMRWRIERDYQDLKQDFGVGHYEGRNWRGFHHYATLSIAAYGFLMAQRLKAGRDGGGKTSLNAKCLPFPKDYVPRGSPSRAASRTRLDHYATPSERRTRKHIGPLSALQLDKPEITFVTQ